MWWRSSSERFPGGRSGALAVLAALCLGPAAGLAAEPVEATAEAAPTPRGPLALRSQNPAFLMFFRLGPTAATVPEAGHGSISLTSAYSSFFLAEESSDGVNVAVLDGELWRNTLRGTVGLGRRLALSVEIPTLYGGGGFLDNIIEEYHDVFGFNQSGRDRNPDDQFVFGLVTDTGLAFFLPENDLDWGDVSATLDWAGWEETERRPAILLRAGVELATGDEEIGYGNGGTDFGIGVATEKSIGMYTVYADAGYQWLAVPRRFELSGVRVRDTWSADLAAERSVGRRVVLIGQIGYEQSPLRYLDLSNLDRDSVTLAISLSWSVSSRWRLDFSFQEDLDSESSQDLTGHLGVGWRF